MSTYIKPLFETAIPRPPEQTNDAYAANLSHALREIVNTPQGAHDFLMSTHVTPSMRNTCNAIMDRIANGNTANRSAVYTFDSGFGGGKTHTAIALGAMARHPEAMRNISPEQCPADPVYATDEVCLIAINGQDADSNGRIHIEGDLYADSISSAVSYHLGLGSSGNPTHNPGTAAFSSMIGDRPVLILLDELAQLLNKLVGESNRPRRESIAVTLSDLAAAVSLRPRAVMIITVPEPGADALQEATEEVHKILNDISSLMARVTRAVSPSDAIDIPHILRKRLFIATNEDQRNITAEAYAQILNQGSSEELDNHRQRFYENYPFHPDLIEIINTRVNDNANFQQVRGTLRLLGDTIHLQKERGMTEAVIHPYHVDPKESRIRDQFITRLERRELNPGIEADIAGNRNRGTPLAHESAITIMLGSVAPSAKRGLTKDEVVNAVISPTQPDRGIAENAIKHLADTALYINEEAGRGLWFSNEPSLRKMAEDRQNALRGDRAWLEKQVQDAILDTFHPKLGTKLFQVKLWPTPGNNLPDEANNVWLGIVNTDYLYESHPKLETDLMEMFRHSPANGGKATRQHPNNAMFLVATQPNTQDLEEAIVRREAYRLLLKDGNLKDHQKDEAREREASAQKALYQSIQRNWCNLYYPNAKSQRWPGSFLERIAITQNDQEGKGEETIVNALTGVGKAVNPKMAAINPTQWQERSSLRENKAPTLDKLYEEFTDSPSMQMFLSKIHFTQAIAYAVKEGHLEMMSATKQRFERKDAPDARMLQDDFTLYLPGKMPKPEPEPKKDSEETRDEDKPSPMPQTNKKFQQQNPMRVLQENLRKHMDNHSITLADAKAVTIHHTDHKVLTAIASVWQGDNHKVELSWTCPSEDGGVTATLRKRSPDWWQQHKQDIDRVHNLAGKPGSTDAQAIITPEGDSEKLESTLRQLGPYDLSLTVVFD